MTDLVVLAPSQIEGVGCHATVDIPAGTHLGIARWYLRHDDTELRWCDIRLGKRMNHADDPNTLILVEHAGAMETWHSWTCRDIAAGEELTVDYRITEK